MIMSLRQPRMGYAKIKRVTFKSKMKVAKNKFETNHPHLLFSNEIFQKLKNLRLLRAATTNNTETVKALLESGADPNFIDKHTRSALHLSTSRGYKDVVESLLFHGADPNIKDIIGNTPLHLAACTNNLPIITLLLDGGADVRSLNTHGRNPVQLAQSKLQLLQKNSKNGSIEMTDIKTQLKQINDLLMCMKRCDDQYFSCKTEDDLKDLDFFKLSINSGREDLVDDQITRLMAELEEFSIN